VKKGTIDDLPAEELSERKKNKVRVVKTKKKKSVKKARKREDTARRKNQTA